jgi:5-methylcytosine-specific restriction enzyme A
MPSAPCHNPTCSEIVANRGDVCPSCAREGRKPASATIQRHYDKHRRDRDAKSFYNSAAWMRCRRAKLSLRPTCERCGAIAQDVHHIKPLKQCSPSEKIAQANLMSLCDSCHTQIEKELR